MPHATELDIAINDHSCMNQSSSWDAISTLPASWPLKAATALLRLLPSPLQISLSPPVAAHLHHRQQLQCGLPSRAVSVPYPEVIIGSPPEEAHGIVSWHHGLFKGPCAGPSPVVPVVGKEESVRSQAPGKAYSVLAPRGLISLQTTTIDAGSIQGDGAGIDIR